MKLRNKRIAVLGAGLQGACVALELAGHDAQIDLYERNASCLAETSANNEGKVHLGHTYAYDTSFKSAERMIEGALCFERLLRRWIGDSVESLPVSSPFHYLVHRNGLMTPDAFETHATRVMDSIAHHSDTKTSPYFGRDLLQPIRRLTKCDVAYRDTPVVAAFQTEEIGIDPEALSTLVRRRLTQEVNIKCLTEHRVLKVRDNGKFLSVEFFRDGQHGVEPYDYVINTLGSDRLRVDASLGIHASRPWAYRLKYFLRAHSQINTSINSATIVLGPFGDIVNYGNGMLYLSWYPAGMIEWSNSLSPPVRPLTLRGRSQNAMVQNILRGLSNVVPEVVGLKVEKIIVNGGWIYGFGQSDIDDPRSGLHQRFEVGVQRFGRYLTIDPGKLTLVPMFAERAVDLLRSSD